jgi:hypothetical protein
MPLAGLSPVRSPRFSPCYLSQVCPQGDTYQKPVTEPSLGGVPLDLDHSIAQIRSEGKRASTGV